MNKTCPKCGAGYNGRSANQHDYRCASTMCNDVNFYQSPECVRRERDQLLARNRELKEALELLVCGAVMVQRKGYAFAQLDRGVAMARAALAKAKEAKP